MKKYTLILLFLLLIPVGALSFVIHRSQEVEAQGTMTVKDTLSSSQLSFFGRLGIGNSAGNSIVKILGNGNSLPSMTTDNVFIGDTLAIGSGTSATSKYVVRDIANSASFVVDPPLAGANIGYTLPIYATRSAIHTVYFTPQSTSISGFWRFMLRAPNSPEVGSDGIPDQTGFDVGSTSTGSGSSGPGTRIQTGDISCPFGSAASNIGTTTIIANNPYLLFTCQLGAGASNPVGIGASWIIGRDFSLGSQIINPSPARNHVVGTTLAQADSYSYILQLQAADGVTNIVTIPGKIAVIESVRVTATVDPLLIFQIGTSGVGVGSTVCGKTGGGLLSNAADTTATAIKYGSLLVNQFNDLAHRLTCATNAGSGYVVTAYETSKLQYILASGAIGATFADATCDSGGCGIGTTGEWSTSTNNSRFGYSLQNISAASVPFFYNQGTGSTFVARAFGIGFSNAQPIMWNNNTPNNYEEIYICYRTTVNMFQKAANYQTGIVYTATATF